MTTDDITEHKAKLERDAYTIHLFRDGSLFFATEDITLTFDDIDEASRWADACGDRQLVIWLAAQKQANITEANQ